MGTTTKTGGRRAGCVSTSALRAAALVSMLGMVAALGGCRADRANQGGQGGNQVLTPIDGGMNQSGMNHVISGEQFLDSGDRQRALAEFSAAIATNPTLVDGHMGIGDVYRLDGDFSRAETSYRRAAELAPGSFDAQYYHGLMLHLLDRVTDAINSYLRALAIKPDDFQSNLNISAAYYQLGETNQALSFGDRAVRLNPRSGPARVNMAAVFADMNRHAEAVVEYQQAAELMELTPKLLLGYSESLKSLERFGEMRSTLEQLVKTAPSAAAWERLGYAQFKLEQYDTALVSFNKSLQIDNNYFPALNGVGVCELNRWYWSNQRDVSARDRGISALRRSLAINRNQAQIENLLGRYR